MSPYLPKTADLARKHGISEATLYNWKRTGLVLAQNCDDLIFCEPDPLHPSDP